MKTVVERCVYIGDGVPDFKGNDRCTSCRLPRTHPSHQLPPAPAAAREHDNAVLGEHEEEL